MAAKIIAFVCLQFALFNTINAQCLNRFIPGCGPNLLPMPLPVAETILPNNQIVIGPNYGQPLMEVPYGVETIISKPALPATTIIQDSTVANNLANALQLLVVSNLLSNTLPTAGEVVVPAVGGFGSALDYGVMAPINPVVGPYGPVMSPINSCGCGIGGPYSFIY